MIIQNKRRKESSRMIGGLACVVLLTGCDAGQSPQSSSAIETQTEPITAATPVVGIVDMQRLSQSLGLELQLKQKRQKLQVEWDRVNTQTRRAITEKLESLGGDAKQLSDSGREQLRKLDLDRRRQLEELDRKNTAALQETNRWLQRVLMEKTRGPIAEIGKEKRFDLILVQPRGGVAYMRPGVDVTDLVLKKAGGPVGVVKKDAADNAGRVEATNATSDTKQ